MSDESFLSQLKRALVGAPIPSHLAHHERLSRVTGLAVLSSDALSSVAYATEEILRVLLVGGVAALSLVTPIGIIIAVMLAIVVFSYRQTIYAYPSGGGAYIVAKENLGTMPGLIAAASLLIDYVLTVAVSMAAGVAALTSAFPHWVPYRVEIGAGVRGADHGRQPARDTRVRSDLRGAHVLLHRQHPGDARSSAPGDISPARSRRRTSWRTRRPPASLLTTFALLTAFSNGCTAMTGVEAVSNGVPAFRPPESRNAASTLMLMGVLSITMFMGITLLAHAYALVPNDAETVVSQLARATFGGGTVLYFAAQAATMLILVLAANTAYADFPRLASIVARDRFLPRQFTNSGRSTRVFERHSDSERACRRPPRRIRRRHPRADSALHDRRLRLVHALAGRHGDPLAPVARARLAIERIRERLRRARHRRSFWSSSRSPRRRKARGSSF